jgi:hypothetical protein
LLLSHIWFRLAIEGHTFSSVGGFSMLPVIDSLPFAWPYLVAGFLSRWLYGSRIATWWTVLIAVAAAVLHSLLVHVQLVSDVALSAYIHFYSRFAVAPLCCALGFFIAHFARGYAKPSNQSLERTAGRSVESL